MTIKRIRSPTDFFSIAKALPAESLLINYFFKNGCPACVRTRPLIDDFNQRYASLTIVEIDLDSVPDIPEMYGVRSVPSLLFFRAGHKIDSITGADEERIRQIFAKVTAGDKLRGNVLGHGDSLNGETKSVLLEKFSQAKLDAIAKRRKELRLMPLKSVVVQEQTKKEPLKATSIEPTPNPAPTTNTTLSNPTLSNPTLSNPTPSNPTPSNPTLTIRNPTLTIRNPGISSEKTDSRPIESSHREIPSVYPKKVFIECKQTGMLFENQAQADQFSHETGLKEFTRVLKEYNPLDIENNAKIQELIGMGFTVIMAQKSVVYTKNAELNRCVDWIFQHTDDADADQPIPEHVLVDYFTSQKLYDTTPRIRLSETNIQHKQPSSKTAESPSPIVDAEDEAEKQRINAEKAKTLELLRKQKEADLAHRERIRRQMEEDRSNQKQKRNPQPEIPPATIITEAPLPIQQPSQKEEPKSQQRTQVKAGLLDPADPTAVCVVQVRLFDGRTVRHEAHPMETLAALHARISMELRSSDFKIATAYPRVIYKEEELCEVTFLQAGLYPNGTVSLSR